MSSKTISALLLCLIPWLLFCKGNVSQHIERPEPASIAPELPLPNEISGITLAPGYSRYEYNTSSFAHWLRKVRLKKDNTVYLFDGSIKPNQQAQFAVLDISVGKKNLQQCADAAMRMRAEYLFHIKKYNAIHFTDNAGTVYQFSAPFSKEHLLKYLDKVFGMCGTASLAKQMKSIPIEDMQPGDVLLRGGYPGHAAMVMDVAINKDGKKNYLLAQSYMPAQDIHILKNPSNTDDNPWYTITNEPFIKTPEYVFKQTELKRW